MRATRRRRFPSLPFLSLPRRDKSIVCVSFEEATMISALREVAGFHVGKGLERRTGSEWNHLDRDPETARSADRLKLVELFQAFRVNAINFSDDTVPTARLVEHHW